MSKFHCVLILNSLAILLLLSAFFSIYHHRFKNLLKHKVLFASIFICIFASILCILLHYNLTKDTQMAHYVILGCITMLYFVGMVLPVAWISFLLLHLYNDENLLKRNLKSILAPCIVIQILLILNLFFGFFFTISPPPQNLYIPNSSITITGIVQFGYILISLIIYYNFKKSSQLAFFSIAVFLIPVIAVLLTSTIFSERPIMFMGSEWPFIAIVVISLCFSLQNELVFKDNLTQLYNRDYLDIINSKIEKSKTKKQRGMILMDINDFKGINDNFGHKEGDNALVTIAKAIKKAIFNLGIAVRYGGDEFIIFVNLADENLLQSIVNSINLNLETLNKNALYKISFSYGFGIFDPKDSSMCEILKILDERMYESKRNLYTSNLTADMRKNCI